jgi:putative transposase
VDILKESEGGIPVANIFRTHRVSQDTFYKWRSKYRGPEASELKRMKDLEPQLSEYKTIVAELTSDNRALKNLVKKNSSVNG